MLSAKVTFDDNIVSNKSSRCGIMFMPVDSSDNHRGSIYKKLGIFQLDSSKPNPE